MVEVDVVRSVSWWRPLAQWVLCIPHLVWMGALQVASGFVVLGVVGSVLVGGKVPGRLASFQALSLRQRARTFSFFWVLRDTSPPFATAASSDDPGDDPLVSLSFTAPTSASRVGILTRLGVLLLHLVVLAPIGLVMDLGYPVFMVIAAVNRGWPDRMAGRLVAVERWVVALAGYVLYATDRRPSFGLAAYSPPTVPRPC